MKNYENIIEIDKLLVFHKPLIKCTGVCGLAGDYHEPRKGTTLILSKDRSFRVEWHEGAHSFLSQVSLLGLIINILTTTTHIQLEEIINTKQNINDLKIKSSVVRRLNVIREEIIENFLVAHEIFAFFTERRGILGQNFFDSMDHIDNVYKNTLKVLASMDAEVIERGLNQHKFALNFIKAFKNIYGHLRYAGDAAEFSIHLLPAIITNVSPRDLLFGSSEVLAKVIPYPNNVFEKLLLVKPKWAPDSSLFRTPDFFDLVIKNINLQSEYRNVMKNIESFGDWFIEFLNILPLGEKWKDALKGLLHRYFKFLYFPSAINKSELKEHVKFLNLDKDAWDSQKQITIKSTKGVMKSLLSENFIKERETIAYDPISIPPPVTLYQDPDGLVLAIRSDAFNPEGLNHFLYIFTELSLTEMLLNPGFALKKRAYPYPILCFLDSCEIKAYECGKGLGHCMLSYKMELVASKIKESYGINADPLLICCRKDTAQVARVSHFKNSLKKPKTYPLKIKEVKPKMYGFRLKN